MNGKYEVGDLVYDSNVYDRMNTDLSDLEFYKKWLPKNKSARILELCCGSKSGDNGIDGIINQDRLGLEFV